MESLSDTEAEVVGDMELLPELTSIVPKRVAAVSPAPHTHPARKRHDTDYTLPE